MKATAIFTICAIVSVKENTKNFSFATKSPLYGTPIKEITEPMTENLKTSTAVEMSPV